MSHYIAKFLYNRKHQALTIEPTDNVEWGYIRNMIDVGEYVLASHQLARLLDEREVSTGEVRQKIAEAKKAGDVVFAIDSGCHSDYWFRFTSNLNFKGDPWDGYKGCFFVVKAGILERDFGNDPDKLLEHLNECAKYLEAALNGDLWVYTVEYGDNGDTYFSQAFLSPEAALEAATYEYPGYVFSDEDFDVIYKLKPESDVSVEVQVM